MSNTPSSLKPLHKTASRFAANSRLDTSELSLDQSPPVALLIADQFTFAAALLSPPSTNEALQRAFATQRELIQKPSLQK